MRRALLPWGPGRGLNFDLSGQLVLGHGCITYSEAIETSGTASSTVQFYDGAGANGQVLMEYSLAASQSTSEQWGPHWMPFEQGLFYDVTAGACSGSLTVWVDHDCEWWLEVAHQAAELTVARDLAALGVTPGG